MKSETEAAIASILARVEVAAINIRWKTTVPLGGLGERKSKSTGHGTEFFELDEYQPGDDIRMIEWNATARSGGRHPVKVVQREERRIACYVLANIDHSMLFGTVRCSKRTLATEMAATIFQCVDKTRDKAGLVLYSRFGVEGDVVPPASVCNTLYPALTGLIETEVRQTKTGSGSAADGADGLARALSELPNHRSLVFVLSDFLKMTENDWNELANAAVLHDVIAIYIQDLRERELPKVWWPGCAYDLQDYDGKSRLIWNSPRARRKHAEAFRAREQQVIADLEQRHCEVLTVSTEQGDEAMPGIISLFANH